MEVVCCPHLVRGMLEHADIGITPAVGHAAADLRTPVELEAYANWHPPEPKPEGMEEYESKSSQAAEPTITRAHCTDTLLCVFTHHYQSCNNNLECKSNQCNGIFGGACPFFGCGECAAEPGSILPWDTCATDEECMSNDCDFELPTNDRGFCTLDHSRRARSGCRCQKNEECLSGVCAGPLFDQDNHRCTAESGSTLAGNSCPTTNASQAHAGERIWCITGRMCWTFCPAACNAIHLRSSHSRTTSRTNPSRTAGCGVAAQLARR